MQFPRHILKIFVFVSISLALACSGDKNQSESERPSFKDVQGIRFIEVRRAFDTGLSFSKQGFQQVPEWDLYFLPGDSVKIYSPFEKKYIYYPIYFDHKNVVNFAREWLRIVHVSKDSLVFQLLEVQSREVKKDLSTVFMHFYSEKYLQRRSLSATELRNPRKADTLFI
jgi:hypothetical protein